MAPAAKEKYGLAILPAGRNDRMARITGSGGNILRLIHCPRKLGAALGEQLDEEIRRDWEEMDADAFARKYELPEGDK